MKIYTKYLKGRNLNKVIATIFIITSFTWLYSTKLGLESVGDDDFQSLNGQTPLKSSLPSQNVLDHLISTKNITEKYQLIHDEEDDLKLLDFDRANIKYIYPEVISQLYNHTDLSKVDWMKYAYVLYATSSSHMCNAMMIFAELRKFETKAQLVLLVKREFLTEPNNFKYEHETLTKFAQDYNVRLKPTKLIQGSGDSVQIWTSSFTKLLVFNETEYDRIIYMDTDAILLRGNLDELFFIPPCQMAVSTAYWHTKRKYEKLGDEEINKKYAHSINEFTPLTQVQRERKINQFNQENILEYQDDNGFLPNTLSGKIGPLESLGHRVNEKNFYTNVYNNLPNYTAIDEFDLTNIVMVIEPSKGLFQRVLKAIDARGRDEFDMDIVQNHLFPLKDVLKHQESNSVTQPSKLTFTQRFQEIPEFLLLPHQVYGTITPELNSQTKHASYLADAHEQIFTHLNSKTSNHEPAYYEIDQLTNPGDVLYSNIKYLHFSDAPIPKPWFKQNPKKEYMASRSRCPSHPDYKKEGVVKPKYETNDCSSGKNWENAHEGFKIIRKEVCQLDLIDTDEDTYHGIIN